MADHAIDPLINDKATLLTSKLLHAINEGIFARTQGEKHFSFSYSEDVKKYLILVHTICALAMILFVDLLIALPVSLRCWGEYLTKKFYHDNITNINILNNTSLLHPFPYFIICNFGPTFLMIRHNLL